MTDRTLDFTRGDVRRQLVTFATPIMATNLLQSSFQLIDSLWVGNLLGVDALGAVAVSTTIIFTTLSFVVGMNNAALTVLSQLKGRGDHEGLKRYLNAFVSSQVTLAVGLGIVGYLGTRTVLRLLGTPDDLLQGATDYLQITFFGIVFLFGYNFIGTALRALGDSRTPLRFVVLAVALNIVLDPLFIHTFGWGIRGAAAATVASQGIACTYGVWHVVRHRSAPLQLPRTPAGHELRTVFRLGVPAGLQMAVISGGITAIMSVVTGFGGSVVGGFGAAQRLDALIMVPGQALGIAVASMAGQNIGRGDWARVGHVTRAAVRANLVVMGSIGLVMFLVADHAVRLFVDDPEAIAFGARYLRIIAVFYPFLGINFVLNGTVRASGAMYAVLALNVISFWVLRYPLTAGFAHVLGEDGIALGVGTSFVLSSVCAVGYYRYGRWRATELFDTEPSPARRPGGAEDGAAPATQPPVP